MKQVSLPPYAPVLLESMRAVGYDASAAVADIIDNSITAGAKHVQIRFDPGIPKAIAIVDDGRGMSAEELLQAMRHGSRSPNGKRAANDLGRFGLGLKTASMSQCRRLVVVTRRDGFTSAMAWDLDQVAKAKDWLVEILDDGEISCVPFASLLKDGGSGTLVVWEKLDRLAADDPGDGSILSERMDQVGKHLALVFHRLLSGKSPLRITINSNAIEPIDPFLEGLGSSAGPEESIRVDGHKITLRSFTLPHISRLSRAQIERAGGEQGLRRQQGFYIYRGRRLIIWGTWFRLFRQEELTKLTRVRVDVPNALDHLWSLDIKKAAASPPAAIRERLRGLVPTLTQPSRQTQQYRGRTTATAGITPIWNRIEDRDGVRYEVNPSHPLLAAFRETLEDDVVTDFDSLLRAVAESYPVEALYNDRANDQIGHRRPEENDPATEARLEDTARQILEAFHDLPQERQRLLASLPTIEPFSLYPRLAARVQRKLS